MRIGMLMAACLTVLLVYLGAFMRLPIIPLYAESVGASIWEVGLITSAFMLMAAVLAIPFGLTSDRIGRKRLIVLGLAVNASASFLFLFAVHPYLILLVYTFAGFGIAAYTPAIIAFVGDVSLTSHIGRAYGLFTTFMAVGMAVGPGIGGFTASFGGYGLTFILSGIIILVGLFVAVMTFQGGLKKQASPSAELNLSQSFKIILSNRIVLICLIAAFCLCFTFGVIAAFLPLYADSTGLSILTIGLLFAAQSIGSTVVRLPFGILADRIGKRLPFIFFGLAGTALGTGFLTSTTNQSFLMALMCLTGLSLGIAFMSMSALIAEKTGPAVRGLAMGTYSTSFYSGFAASPLIIGIVIATNGFQIGFYSAAAVSIFGIVLTTVLTFNSNQKKQSAS